LFGGQLFLFLLTAARTCCYRRSDMLSLLLILAGTAGVLSQNFSSVPECALGCVNEAILGTACSFVNVRHNIAK